MTEQTKQCITCHREQNPALYQQWGSSKHYRGNVGCFECHSANRTDPDAFEHYGQIISTIVTPRDCARCHTQQAEEFSRSVHAKAARTAGSPHSALGELLLATAAPANPHGITTMAVSGCTQCHGSEIKILAGGKPDPATWPNGGIGRINPDGSEGTCTSCHSRHSFTAAQARHPDTCAKCHSGPHAPEKEIYATSAHGINFHANIGEMNLNSAKWIPGEDYWAAPTCATCHMSATRKQGVTHDVGARLSWINRSESSLRPEDRDRARNLPSADVPWDSRRAGMRDVCMSCHHEPWIDGFYAQYDSVIAIYQTKFAGPGKELYELAKPLLTPGNFTDPVDWHWHDIWHSAGRRMRNGAAMMSPSQTQWHGAHEVARRFYSDFVPHLQAIAEANQDHADPQRAALARALQAKLQEVLGSEDHNWYLGLKK
jgi:hydroxylamine dehydrogenase